MFGKCAKFAFALALIAALGFATVHAHPHALKISDSAGFAVPCEPASPGLKATDGSQPISTIHATFGAETVKTFDEVVVRIARVKPAAMTISVAAPRTFPPLLHRPPPTRS